MRSDKGLQIHHCLEYYGRHGSGGGCNAPGAPHPRHQLLRGVEAGGAGVASRVEFPTASGLPRITQVSLPPT